MKNSIKESLDALLNPSHQAAGAFSALQRLYQEYFPEPKISENNEILHLVPTEASLLGNADFLRKLRIALDDAFNKLVDLIQDDPKNAHHVRSLSQVITLRAKIPDGVAAPTPSTAEPSVSKYTKEQQLFLIYLYSYLASSEPSKADATAQLLLNSFKDYTPNNDRFGIYSKLGMLILLIGGAIALYYSVVLLQNGNAINETAKNNLHHAYNNLTIFCNQWNNGTQNGEWMPGGEEHDGCVNYHNYEEWAIEQCCIGIKECEQLIVDLLAAFNYACENRWNPLSGIGGVLIACVCTGVGACLFMLCFMMGHNLNIAKTEQAKRPLEFSKLLERVFPPNLLQSHDLSLKGLQSYMIKPEANSKPNVLAALKELMKHSITELKLTEADILALSSPEVTEHSALLPRANRSYGVS